MLFTQAQYGPALLRHVSSTIVWGASMNVGAPFCSFAEFRHVGRSKPPLSVTTRCSVQGRHEVVPANSSGSDLLRKANFCGAMCCLDLWSIGHFNFIEMPTYPAWRCPAEFCAFSLSPVRSSSGLRCISIGAISYTIAQFCIV